MKQATLFEMGRPELVMVIEDAATSDDPLEQHLERKGWKISRVKDLQASISKKLTIDWVTGATEELSSQELSLQRDITAYLEGARK